MKWVKQKKTKDKQWSTKHYMRDRATRTTLKTEDELSCIGICIFCTFHNLSSYDYKNESTSLNRK